METKIEKTEIKENSLLTDVKRSMNTMQLNLKFVFSNVKLLLIIALFYFISLLLGIIFLPIYLSGGVMQFIAIILPGLIILGAIGSNLKKSTLYKNVFTSGIKRRTFYISQLITIVIVMNILSLVFWLLISFIGCFNIFLGGWVWESAERIKFNPFLHWEPVLIFYITNVTALLTFSFYFLIDSITNSAKTYNLVIAGIFIIGIIFGGSLNASFGRPLDVWNYDWNASGGVQNLDYYHPDYISPIYVTEDFYNSTNGLEDFHHQYNANGISPQDGLLPDFMILPTLIFNPFYGVGEFTTTAITRGINPEYSWLLNQQIIVVTDFTTLTPIPTYATLFSSSKESVSIWSWFNISFKDGAWMWTAVLFQPFITMFAYIGIGSIIRKSKRK